MVSFSCEIDVFALGEQMGRLEENDSLLYRKVRIGEEDWGGPSDTTFPLHRWRWGECQLRWLKRKAGRGVL